MKKSMYSLILSEEVVDAIDRLAYEKQTSRSALINRILAEYVSYTTPEMRREEIFSAIGQILNSSLQPVKSSDSLLVLSSALEYKYNPTVRYSLELYRGKDAIGVMKASLRSQNQRLLATMNSFCLLWQQAEQSMIGQTEALVEHGRYTRVFRLRAGGLSSMVSAEALGNMIAEYVTAYDHAMKDHFHCIALGMQEEGKERVFLHYRKYITNAKEII